MDAPWDDLRIFLAVARTESLSRAGHKLKIDPATVGRRIARLEQSFGLPLFAKSPTGYRLTEMGQRLVIPVARAETALQEAADVMTGQTSGMSGTIRIGAPDGVANFLLPQICTAIAEENPQLDIQIIAQPRVFSLSKREADMVVAVSPPKTGRLTVQKITDYKLYLCAMQSYLRDHPPIETLADLQNHRMIGYIPDMIYDTELDYLSETGVERVNLGSNSVAVQMNWIRQGGGLGIVHDFARRTLPDLVRVLPQTIEITRSFYLVRHADDRRLERLNRFAQALTEGMRREVAKLEREEDAPGAMRAFVPD
ncbi:MAG: LysR family transcriptional regulator [Pseudomonadota bacterium]